MKLTFLVSIFVYGLGVELNAQTQPPSIISGVTFEWDGPQPTTTSPANLVSVTVDGKVYNRFSTPSRYELTRLGPNGHNQNRIVENGVIIESTSDSPTWNTKALAAFSSPNLNFIFESDGNGRNICSNFDAALTSDAQAQTIFYDNLEVVNQDGIIAVSTRNANSCIYVEIVGSKSLGGPEIVLGRFFARPGPSIVGPVFGQPAVGADYWRSGRVNANNGNIGIALFRLDEVAPAGSYITAVRYVGANVNHGDGKVFLIRAESTDLSVVKTVNNLTPDYGDEINFTIKAVNNGVLNANAVQVSDVLPSGFTFISATASRGSYNNATGIWNIGLLDYGDIETLVIRVRVNTIGDYTNSAEISPQSGDPNVENNISTVKVRPINIIVANDLSVTSAANNSNAGYALGNDLINNNPISVETVNITAVIPSNPLVTINPNTGIITVENVPSGTYTISYTICEIGTEPENSNCSTATVTVQVLNQIIAKDDTVIGSPNSTNIGNIFDDNGNGPDVLNEEKVTIELVDIRNVVSSNPLVTLDVNSGYISIGDVPVGTYQIEYTICEKGTDPSAANCSTATVTVEVLNIIEAKDDEISTSSNNPNAGNVLEDNANGADTFNGLPLTIGQVNIAVLNSSDPLVTIDPATGNITIGDVSSGQYTITYSICEKGTDQEDTNCSTATVNVEVRNAIIAKDDVVSTSANNPNAGNVLEDNGNGADSFNGLPLSISQVDIAVVNSSDPLVSIDPATGNITIGNVSSGQYTITYSICEKGADPSDVNCSTATVTVEVLNIIEAKNDEISTSSNNPNAGNVLEDNGSGADTFNGKDLTISQINISKVVPLNPEVSIDPATGNVTVGDVSGGIYEIEYTICEKGANPANCATALVTVIVENKTITIEANDDAIQDVRGTSGVSNVINVLDNDLLDGKPLTLADIVLVVNGNKVLTAVPFNASGNTPEPKVVLNPNGSVDVASNTEPGTYVLVYSICSATNPGICDSATITIEVKVSSIVANDDAYGPLNGIAGATFGNVLENDLIDGLPVKASDVILTLLSGNSELTLNEDGSVTLAPNSPSGEYILIYNICELKDPNNCATAFVTVTAIGDVDIAIEKTSNGVEIWGADVFDYFIKVSNVGIADASNVSIEDLLPEGISFDSQEFESTISNLEVNFEQQGNKLRWTLPVLPVNAVLQIKLAVVAENVTGTRPQVIINKVSVEAEESEANMDNNSATDMNKINPFFIPNVFTPNGNGFNDTFEIVGINKFEKNDLVIYNRYGDQIFQAENYRNNWDASAIVAGTYFYIFTGVDKSGQNQEFKGWVQVIKK